VKDARLEAEDGRFGEDGWWVTPPTPWADDIVERLTAPRLAAVVRAHIETLPAAQRHVVTLRDVEGLSSVEVRRILGISAGNQRVLLHRARASLRRRLEEEVTG
jgi:RNA polymerase sigma-70 factor (ECF subfamily)